MIIKNVKLSREGDITTLSAKCKIRKIGWDTVYFTLTSPQPEYVYEDASPFACALLVASMRQGEDLIIHGSISEKLYEGMDEIMDEMLTWNIGLSRIAIKADKITEDAETPVGTKAGSFFSGGVDSFYTYLKHKTDPVGEGRVDSLILVNGFDIDLRSKELWRMTLENIEQVAKAESVELVVVESNIQKLLEPILSWDFAHGGCLAAVGLFLRGGMNRIYIPSTFTVAAQAPWGSHLKLDHHWSTERIVFVHDGTEATRVEKVGWQVAKSPVALKHLRVCYVNKIGTYNCGVCSKCIRTMVNLYLADALDKAGTFPHELDFKMIAETPSSFNEGEQMFTGEDENINALHERGLNPLLEQALIASKNLTIGMRQGVLDSPSTKFNKLVLRGIQLDHVYTHGRVYVALSRMFGREFV